MKNFLRHIILFLVTSFLFYVAFLRLSIYLPKVIRPNLILVPSENSYLDEKLAEIQSSSSIDLLILGSSHAYRGYDPRIFEEKNIKILNLGSNSQTPLQTEYLVKQYVTKIQPKHVLYEINPDAFTYDGVESMIDFLSREKINQHLFTSSRKIANLKVMNSLLFNVSTKLFPYKEPNFQKLNQKPIELYQKGGFVERLEGTYRSKNFPDRNRPILDYQLKAFKRTLTFLEQKGISVQLVQTPVTQAYYDAYEKNEQFDQQMNSLGNYINYQTKVSLVDSIHFYDYQHLNQKGVELFNRSYLTK